MRLSPAPHGPAFGTGSPRCRLARRCCLWRPLSTRASPRALARSSGTSPARSPMTSPMTSRSGSSRTGKLFSQPVSKPLHAWCDMLSRTYPSTTSFGRYLDHNAYLLLVTYLPPLLLAAPRSSRLCAATPRFSSVTQSGAVRRLSPPLRLSR